MTTSVEAPRTARDLLGERTGAGSAGGVARAVSDTGAARFAVRSLGHLSSAGLASVDREIGRVADGLLDLDLGDLLVLGWRKHGHLKEAARRTLAVPGSEEVVDLAAHRITSTYSPHVDLLVDGVLVNSFEFRLTIVFDLTGIAAVVSAGDLVAVRGGTCEVTGTLDLEGARLAERRAELDLGVAVPLRWPVSLASRADADREAVPRQTMRP